MRATILLTILSASFAFITGGAQARDDDDRGMSGAEQAGYDTGWDAADDFCRDLRFVEKSRGPGFRSVTREFKRGCKMGFDNYIDSNQSCQRRLEDRDMYGEMWAARSDACS